MRRILSLLTGSVVAVGVIAAGPTGATAAVGWTPVASDYATNANTPSFSVCLLSQTEEEVTLKLRAKRPTGFAVGISAYWNTELDHTGESGGANTTYWTSSNEATLVVLLPKDSYGVIGWQSTEAGYGYTDQKRPPLGANRCP